MLSILKGNRKVVGIKQSRKAVREGEAAKAFLAEDAEERVRVPFIELCAEEGIELEMVPTMKELGNACGIEVGAAVAAVLK